MPRISVIIPTYNRSQYVGNAIKSVLQQTYRNIEIIVCDDGSIDNTVDIVKTIQIEADMPIKLDVLPQNFGVSAARNRAISLASGDLIAFLDSDDSWKPDKLAKQIAFLDKNPEYIGVGCSFECISGSSSRKWYRPNYTLETNREIFQMLYNCYILTSCLLVKRDSLILAGLFDIRLRGCEDRDLWWRLISIGRIGYIDEPLVNYLVHEANTGKLLSRRATWDVYVPVVKRAIYPYRNVLRKSERRKIISKAYLTIACDLFEGNNKYMCSWYSIMAVAYGYHILEAMKIFVRSALSFMPINLLNIIKKL